MTPSDREEGRDVHTDACHSPSCPCFRDGIAAEADELRRLRELNRRR